MLYKIETKIQLQKSYKQENMIRETNEYRNIYRKGPSLFLISYSLSECSWS